MQTGPRTVHYMLRRNLPLWKWRSTVEETIGFCLDTGVDEIIWKVDAEEFSHGFVSHELIREYLEGLRHAKECQAAPGIAFSINPWVTQNHQGRGRYPDGAPDGFRWRVHPDGSVALGMACPLSPGWCAWLVEAYRLYATMQPDKLWVEDDFKTFINAGHHPGCYCDAHVAAFSARAGEALSRDDLVRRISAPGVPDPIRLQWFDFCGEIMVRICGDLARAVHAESPATRLGLMCSWSSDGRWWADAVKALAGPHRPLTRTSLAPYEETRTVVSLPDRFDILKEQACLPADTQNCPELENFPYTVYTKSAAMTGLHMMLSQALGNPDITMNLFDMVGGGTSEEPRYGRMLRDLKPFLSGMAALAGPGGIPRGVSIPFPVRYADFAEAPSEDGMEVFRFDGDGWAHPLQGSGIPVFLNGESSVVALTGQSARAMGRDAIRQCLSGGLLLDGSAAAALQALGHGEHLGATVGERIPRYGILISAERDDGSAQGSTDDPTYLAVHQVVGAGKDFLYRLDPAAGTVTASTFVDPDRAAVLPGFVLFENMLGGRTAVYPFDLSGQPGAGFMSWKRRAQLQRVVRWLNHDRVDLIADGGAWMMPVRRDFADYTFIAVLNFDADAWDSLSLTFEHAADPDTLRFEWLQPDGGLDPVSPDRLERDGANLTVGFDRAVAPLAAAVLRLRAHPHGAVSSGPIAS